MKLELKHLAPYLPYQLEIEISNYKCDYVGIKRAVANGFYFIGDSLHITYKGGSSGKDVDIFKPILRPLSDIQDTSSKWKEMASEMGLSNNDDYLIEKDIKSNQYLSYNFQTWLISNHFDVFGLIEQGLAIDINTLNQNI